MTTITLQIGNSDDRLSQSRWNAYVEAIQALLESHSGVQVHFFGAPPNWSPWQNAAWVFACDEADEAGLCERAAAIRAEFDQDSIAWTRGDTRFV